MFRLYNFLESVRPELPEVKKIYRVRGLASLDDLLNGIREGILLPGIAADAGFEGVLDIEDKFDDKSYHTFHVLLQCEVGSSMEQIDKALQEAYQIGRKVVLLMRRLSGEPDEPCYGFDAASISYSTFGPIGMQCYGCTFNVIYNNDHGR